AARLSGNSTSVFYSLRLRLTLAVPTPVVSFRSTHHSVCISKSASDPRGVDACRVFP
ncbi:unnamed protein product, partial [Ascophyllum nodosum]